MPTWTGYFANPNSPALKISVYGVWPQTTGHFDAVVDTGFTGFLAMPLLKALPLALVLFGTTSVVLADGSNQFRLTAWGHVIVEGEENSGVIILQPGESNVILGIDFLRRFKKTLVISPGNQRMRLADDWRFVEPDF